jgi:uncharacterized protein (TIGR00255 family)
MLKSMTGFGKAECLLPSKKITIEIKSLNSKQIDTSTRLPAIFKEKELEIRQMLSKSLERGKVECTLHYELVDGASASINTVVLKDYLHQLKGIIEEYDFKTSDLLSTLIRLPDTVISEKLDLLEDEWNTVKNSIENSLNEVNNFRIQEGKALEKDLRERIKIIEEKSNAIQPFEEERIKRVKERIFSNLGEVANPEDIDKNRFEQELIYYLEKLDINEEKVRLKNHLDYFLEILSKGSPNGRKLTFISQEIGREVNTLGSKANHDEIQRLVVDMKDELEKIKEQLLNVL